MYRFSTYKQQYKANLKLALPVVMTQLGQILVQVADNVMVGRYGGDDPTPLAATSFGGSVFFILFIAGVGIALGLTPLIGELYAQGDRHKSSQYLQNGVMFYTLLGFLVCGLQLAVIPLMYHMGQPVEVVDMAIPYYKLLAYSMPFIMLFLYLQAVPRRRRKHPGRNGRGDSLQPDERRLELDFHLRPPRIRRTGCHGCGARHPRIAHRHADHDYRLFLQKTEIPRLSSRILAPQLFGQNDPHIAAYGPSISLQMFLEASAFVGTSIMMGWLSKTAISANQIAMTLGNCAFMIVTSIGAATTIRISHCYGARSLKELTLAAKASYHLVIAWNLFAAITFISLCNVIPTFFTTNAEVIDLASKLILLIAVYQLADGIQNVSVGILRGIQDVKIIMPIAFLSYIVFNLPVGYLLGFTLGMGAQGADPGLHRRSYDGRRTADRPLPPRHPALEGRHPIIRDLRFPAATHVRPTGICRSLSRINLALLPDFTIFTEIYDSNG